MVFLDFVRFFFFRHARRLVDHRRHVSSDSVVVQKTLSLTDSGDSDIFVPEVSLSASLDVINSDGVDRSLDLLGGESLAGGDHLSTNVLGDGGGAIETEKEGSLELGLGSLNLDLGRGQRQTGPLFEGEVGQVIDAREAIDGEREWGGGLRKKGNKLN